MPYLLKQKFNITELAPAQAVKHVMLVEPEYYAREVYLKHLSENGYGSSYSTNIPAALVILQAFRPDAIILSPHSEKTFENFIYGLSAIRRIHPQMPMVTVGNSLPVNVLSEIMSLGVVGHLEKKLTRPGDIIAVIKTVLEY